MTTATINLRGVNLDVDYTFIPAEGDGRNSPRIPAYPEINKVEHQGESVWGLVENDLDEIAELTMKAHNDECDYWEAEKWVYDREMAATDALEDYA